MAAVLGSTIPGTGGGGSSDGGPKPGDLIADRYQIERFIGRGGMAEVFAGLNVRTGKRVALKWIRPALATTTEALARFRREAVAAGRIHHPNVVTVFDVVEHKSATWLVMELLEGETLSEILNRVERMDAEEAVMLLIPAMRGVAAAHAHGVVHRDLKPDNIFICRASDGQRREAKVLDFGVSKLSDEAGGEQVSITVTGNLVGTPTYMAPEQVRGNKVVDPRSDVYSLGVVLYQMLAGRPPFQGQVYSALMIEIATADPPPLRSFRPDLSAELEEIVHRAMARDLDRRYPDVTTFVHALENLIGIDSGQVVGRMQALHSEPIMLRTESSPMRLPPQITPVGTAAMASATLPKEDTNTLELARQRGRRIRLVAISIGAAVLIAFGIKVIVTSNAHRAMEAVEEQSPVELRHQPPAPAAKPTAAPAASVPEPAPTAAVTVPETAANRARRLPVEPADATANLAHQRGHMKLSVSKIERTSERPSERSNDSASDHAVKAAEKPVAPAAPTAETARSGTTPTTPPPAPAAPASRAGKISIDDF
jgi:serine/threonine protein kinase